MWRRRLQIESIRWQHVPKTRCKAKPDSSPPGYPSNRMKIGPVGLDVKKIGLTEIITSI